MEWMVRCRAVIASDPQGVIGQSGQLPWHYPEDLSFFRCMSLGAEMLMGAATYRSLPPALFKGRTACVLTRSVPSGSVLRPGVYTLDRIEAMIHGLHADSLMIGGGQIFSSFLEADALSSVYLTLMNRRYSGDAFIPLERLRDMGVWECLRVYPEYVRYRVVLHPQ